MPAARKLGRPAEEQKVRDGVRAYLRGAIEHPHDARPLDVRSVAAAADCSPTTLYKYRLERIIQRIAKRRKKAGSWTPRGAARAQLDLQLLGARREAEEWKQRYTTLLERLVIIEDKLRNDRRVDLDKIYAEGVPLVDRGRPLSARGRGGALHPRSRPVVPPGGE